MSSDKASTHPRELAPETLDPSDVEAFLLDHPAFFKHRPELLASLEFPHGGEGAVSLVERQVNLLRERNIEMRARLNALSSNADANESVFSATRALVLRLLETDSNDAVARVFEKGLRRDFNVDYASLIWFEDAAALLGFAPDTTAERTAYLASLLRGKQAFSGVFRDDEMAQMFPGCRVQGSAAIAPLLDSGELVGAIAVGSDDVNRYDADVGTLFLEYLADVIIRLPRRQDGAT